MVFNLYAQFSYPKQASQRSHKNVRVNGPMVRADGSHHSEDPWHFLRQASAVTKDTCPQASQCSHKMSEQMVQWSDNDFFFPKQGMNECISHNRINLTIFSFEIARTPAIFNVRKYCIFN
jgi:hypothetical protein